MRKGLNHFLILIDNTFWLSNYITDTFFFTRLSFARRLRKKKKTWHGPTSYFRRRFFQTDIYYSRESERKKWLGSCLLPHETAPWRTLDGIKCDYTLQLKDISPARGTGRQGGKDEGTVSAPRTSPLFILLRFIKKGKVYKLIINDLNSTPAG